MRINGAVIKKHGQIFAVVSIKQHVIQTNSSADEARRIYTRYFPEMPIVFMIQDPYGTPTYQGREDIVAFLATLHLKQIPWRTYTFR